MKNIVLIIFACLLSACAPKRQQFGSNFENYSVVSECPDDADCEFLVIKDKSLTIKTSGNGGIYYQLTDSPGRMVVKYTYNKKTNPAYADGNYREEFLFETDKNFSNVRKGKNNNTGIIKLFGIHCFCKGKAGYHPIHNAVIYYENNTLHFTVPAVAEGQKTTIITIAFK